MEYGNGDINRLVWRTTANRYHHEEDKLMLDNPNVNISVLGNQIDQGSYVLDVGCGEGKLGKLLKEKKCSVFGVEIDDQAIRFAARQGTYEAIFHFNIEEPERNIDEYNRFAELDVKFDYVVMADVLEHTVNPTKAIEQVTKYMKEEGKILISVPNINNADIALNLLRGKFNYMESGILDNTHTKYFTKTSFLEWIKDINETCNIRYDCEYLGGIYGLTDYLDQLKSDMPLVYSYIQLNPEYNVIQNLFILYRKSDKERTPLLDTALNEKRVDLVKSLSDLLEKGIDDRFLSEINGIRVLPNERLILEEKVRVSEKGWQESDGRYNEMLKALKESEKKNEESLEGWQESDRRYNEILKALKESEKKSEENLKGWQESDRKYNEILKALEESEKKSEENLKGWQESDRKYNEILKALEESEKKSEENLKGWQDSEKKSEENLKGWQESDRRYNEMLEALKESEKRSEENLKGWQESDMKYNEAMRGWQECDRFYREKMGESGE